MPGLTFLNAIDLELLTHLFGQAGLQYYEAKTVPVIGLATPFSSFAGQTSTSLLVFIGPSSLQFVANALKALVHCLLLDYQTYSFWPLVETL